MRIWITRWALTEGILEADTDRLEPGGREGLYGVRLQHAPGRKGRFLVAMGRDAFDTLGAAQADARMRFIGNEVVARRAHEKALVLAQRAQQEPIQVFPLDADPDLRRPFS